MDIYVPTETGHWVNEKFSRIAEIIHDYDPEMELAWIPPERRGLIPDKPYAVVHKPDGLKEYVMFKLEEDELDERVLARIFNGDAKHVDVLANLEAMDRARKVMEMKERMDKAADRQDFIASVVGSHKHSFRHNGKVIPK